jgi:hypothetical protein
VDRRGQSCGSGGSGGAAGQRQCAQRPLEPKAPALAVTQAPGAGNFSTCASALHHLRSQADLNGDGRLELLVATPDLKLQVVSPAPHGHHGEGFARAAEVNTISLLFKQALVAAGRRPVRRRAGRGRGTRASGTVAAPPHAMGLARTVPHSCHVMSSATATICLAATRHGCREAHESPLANPVLPSSPRCACTSAGGASGGPHRPHAGGARAAAAQAGRGGGHRLVAGTYEPGLDDAVRLGALAGCAGELPCGQGGVPRRERARRPM